MGLPSTFAIAEVGRKQLDDAKNVLDRLYNFTRPYQQRYDELFRHYIGYAPPRYFPDKKTPRSNAFIPYPFANVEQVRAEIMQALFLRDPAFECLPKGMRDSQAALAMQKVLELKLFKEAKLRSVMDDFAGGLCVYGIQSIYVGWDWDYDTLSSIQALPVAPDANTPSELIGQNPETGEPLVINPATGMPLLQRQMVPMRVPRNRPLLRTIDIYDLLIDPDGAYVAHMYDKTLPQMLREQESARANGQRLYDEDAFGKLQALLSGDPKANNKLIHIAELWDVVNNTYKLLTYEEDLSALEFKDKRFANRSASYHAYRRETAAAPSLLLSPETPNPFLHGKTPILWTSYIKPPGEVRGLGVIEPSYQMTEHLNDVIRLIEDNWRMGVNQRFFVNMERNMDLEGFSLANVPGGIVPVYGEVTGNVGQVPTHTPSAGDYQLIPLLTQNIETASGQSNFYSRGVGTPVGNETASGIQSVISQASKRTVRVVQNLEENIIEPLLQMTASNIQQNITDDLEVRITDEMPAIPKLGEQAFIRIAPEDLAGAFDFRLMGSLYMENPAVQQANMMTLAQLAATSPELGAFLKPYEGLQELLRVMKIPYPGRFVKTEEEVAAEQMAMMQQQLELEMIRRDEGLAPDERAKLDAKNSGGRGEKPRNYARPSTNPGTSTVRSQGQRGGLNALGLGGAGVTNLGS